MSIKYEMGLSLGGVSIPDPSAWDVSIESLDSSAERDGTGLLNRNMVAEKMNFSYSFNNITWSLAAAILNAVAPASFTAVTPDPYSAGGTRSGTYYVGKRDLKTVYYWEDNTEIARFNLSFNIIEY